MLLKNKRYSFLKAREWFCHNIYYKISITLFFTFLDIREYWSTSERKLHQKRFFHCSVNFYAIKLIKTSEMEGIILLCPVLLNLYNISLRPPSWILKDMGLKIGQQMTSKERIHLEWSVYFITLSLVQVVSGYLLATSYFLVLGEKVVELCPSLKRKKKSSACRVKSIFYGRFSRWKCVL